MKLEDLAVRVLEKLGVLAAGETAEAADLKKAQEKLVAAHAAIVARSLNRWTTHNLPVEVHEPYVSLAAVLVAPDYGRTPSGDWWIWGMSEIATAASTRISQGAIPAEYF